MPTNTLVELNRMTANVSPEMRFENGNRMSV